MSSASAAFPIKKPPSGKQGIRMPPDQYTKRLAVTTGGLGKEIGVGNIQIVHCSSTRRSLGTGLDITDLIAHCCAGIGVYSARNKSPVLAGKKVPCVPVKPPIRKRTLSVTV